MLWVLGNYLHKTLTDKWDKFDSCRNDVSSSVLRTKSRRQREKNGQNAENDLQISFVAY